MPKPIRPVLAQAIGTYGERRPISALRTHFAATWCHRIPPAKPCVGAVVPDGCLDLQWFDGELRIAGPDRQANIEQLPAGGLVVGLRFRPGAAAAWLRITAVEMRDRRVPLEILWGGEARRLAAWIGEAKTRAGIVERLEAAVARRLSGFERGPDALAYSVFEFIAARRGGAPDLVRDLCRHFEMSERTLRRQCQAAFGHGPKALSRILRFQRFVCLARSDRANGLADVALQTGYCDQVHLTRETRRLAGLTPSEIVRQLAG